MKQILLMLAALALVGSACSADVATDDASVPVDPESAAPAQVPQDSAEPNEAEPDAALVAAEPVAPAGPVAPADQDDQASEVDQEDTSQVFNPNGSGDWCEIRRGFEADERSSSNDPVQVEAYYREQGEFAAVLQRSAPPELASDVALIIEVNAGYVAAIEAAEWNILNVDPTIFEALPEGYEQALVNLETYNLEVCGFES